MTCFGPTSVTFPLCSFLLLLLLLTHLIIEKLLSETLLLVVVLLKLEQGLWGDVNGDFNVQKKTDCKKEGKNVNTFSAHTRRGPSKIICSPRCPLKPVKTTWTNFRVQIFLFTTPPPLFKAFWPRVYDYIGATQFDKK